MDKRTTTIIIIAIILLVIFWCAIEMGVFQGNKKSREPTRNTPELGWICDYDKRGEVALWSKPALAFQDGNEIVEVVGMIVSGCVDVNLLEQTTENGILFYKIRVGGQQGWVDVDYYYPVRLGKPDWSSN